MGGLKRVEDRPTPSAVYNVRVYLAAITAAFAAVMIGYDSAFFGSTITLQSFKNEFGAARVSSRSADLVSLYQAGAFFGSLSGYPMGYYLGRRWGLFIAAIVFTIGAAIMLVAKASVGLGPIYGGRVIAGWGIGAASNLTPLYIAEIAPSAIRGQLVGMYEIGWQIGGLVGFFLPYGVTQNLPSTRQQWLIPFAVQIIPSGIFAIGIPFFCVESPRWLISRSRRDEAIKNLCHLRNLESDHSYLVQEVNDIDLAVEQDRTAVGTGFFAPIRHLFTRWHLARRLIITSMLFMWQNGTGINAINYYAPTIFKSIGVTGGNTGLLTTGIFGVVKTVCSLLWAFLMIEDVAHFGRRGLLILGSVGGCLCMFAIAAYIKIENPAANPQSSLPPGGKAAMFFFYLWTFFYSISWNGTPWVINAESFPGAVRQVSQCIAATSNWLWNFAISRATPSMFASMGEDGNGYGVYLFFASMMVLSIPYIILLLPETKNVPLEEMDRLFAERNVWRANTIVMARLQAERADRANGKEEPLFNHDPNKNVGQQQFLEDAEAAKRQQSVEQIA
ncbi:hypothetical protein JCM8097_008949 [Rhodosporidiobolus ruineniae]